jgi:hypothetical protein
MSIAGIFKEVTTITISAWVFGDELTSLNILGVGITSIGVFPGSATPSSPVPCPYSATEPIRIRQQY